MVSPLTLAIVFVLLVAMMGGVIHLLVNPDGDWIAKFSEPEKTIAKAKGLSVSEAEAVDGFARLMLRWD